MTEQQPIGTTVDVDVVSNHTENAETTSLSVATPPVRRTRAPKSKHWCFTLNNYTQANVDRLLALRNSVAYLIFGRETGVSGTPHLQGFVSFRSKKTLQQVISTLGQCHCSIARYITQSIEYCKKDGQFEEIGEPPQEKQQGRRSDLEDFKVAVKEGMTDMRQIREQFSNVYARCRAFVHDYVQDHLPIVDMTNHPLRIWQAELNARLNLEPKEREIIFLVDTVGNTGKSWFFRYYERNHSESTQIILPGKKADMAYILKENNRVVMFDCPRSKQGEFIQYDFLEEIKNGYVFSGKYEPRFKRFKPPHVVVAMNEYPNMEMLSADRYVVIIINQTNNVVNI